MTRPLRASGTGKPYSHDAGCLCAEPAGQHAGRVAGHAAPDQLDDRGRMCRIGYQPPAVRLGPDRNPAGRHGTAGQRPCLLQGVPGFARRLVLSASCDPAQVIRALAIAVPDGAGKSSGGSDLIGT